MLANEEVTADGRSDVGNYPVYRRPLRQWMLRITAYADRLLRRPGPARLAGVDQAAAAELDRPQRRRHGHVSRGGAGAALSIEVFTTRPDTLPGATYLVLAPEHPLVRRAHRRHLADGTPGLAVAEAGYAGHRGAVAAYR